MMQLLQKYADSIDAMALRERILFFATVALVVMTLLQVFLLNPVLSRRNQLSSQIAHQEEETKAMQAQIQSMVGPRAPDQNALNRAKLEDLRKQMSQLDAQFERRQKQFVAPQMMTGMLESLIGKNRKLQLVSLRNLPGTSLSTGAARGGHEIYRHTVELRVKGGYFDLLDYLAALERMPQRVFWDGFELSAAQYPQSVLTLTVYTLSPEKSWLTV